MQSLECEPEKESDLIVRNFFVPPAANDNAGALQQMEFAWLR